MRNRSLFWPFFLIAAGLVWLLIEIRSVPVENLWALMYIWPFFLMAAGVGLILRSRWPVARMFVSGVLVLGMVGAVVFAPQLGGTRSPPGVSSPGRISTAPCAVPGWLSPRLAK